VDTLQTALSRALASKAEMYGFPLIVWSSGALQSHRFGIPGLGEVLAYAGGALVAMAIVILVTCRSLRCALPKRDPSVRAFGGIHVVSVMGSIVAGWAAARALEGWLAFFVASLATILAFEVLLSAELHLAAERRGETSH
jgi:hypothetical protein